MSFYFTKPHLFKLTSILLVFMFCFIFGQSRPTDFLKIENKMQSLSGFWQKPNNFGCMSEIVIDFNEPVSLCIESNQISADVTYELKKQNNLLIINMYLKEPDDLGRGGGALPWRTFDRNTPIAIIDITNLSYGTISLKWLGFSSNGLYIAKYRHLGSDLEGEYEKVCTQ